MTVRCPAGVTAPGSGQPAARARAAGSGLTDLVRPFAGIHLAQPRAGIRLVLRLAEISRVLRHCASALLPEEILIHSSPFGLSLSKPWMLREQSFDKLRANGIHQRFPRLRRQRALRFAG